MLRQPDDAGAWRRPERNLAALDGMRAFAAAFVVLYHCALFTGNLTPAARAEGRLGWLSPIASGGWSGVDVFFVLSGFLIAQGLFRELVATRTLGWRRFWIRRACRIFPAYYLVLAFSLALIAWLPFRLSGYLYGTRDASALLESSWTNLLYLNNYLRPRGAGDVLSWGWSLCIEEHFYLLLPPVLWLVFRSARPRLELALLVLLALAPLAGRALQYHADPQLRLLDGFYYRSHNRFDELLVGVLLAYLHVRHPGALAAAARRLGHATWVLGAALLASVLAFGGLEARGAFAVVWQFDAAALGAGLLLVNGLALRNAASRFFASPVWYPLARVSYGVYLVHPFVLFALLEAAGVGEHARLDGPLAVLVLFALVLGAASLVAAGLYLAVERPWLERGRRWAQR